MLGHQRDMYSTYKRLSSRDHPNESDFAREDGLDQPVISGGLKELGNPSWKRPLPHILVAIISSLVFGYHLGVVNDTLHSISVDLDFKGDTMAEGLVVSTCLGGAFLGSMISGWIADGVGRKRAFQLCALPMIVGASLSAASTTLRGMLLGRFLVGTGMGLGPPVAALYVAEVSPVFVRGTYGSFTQIATAVGLVASFLIGAPAKNVMGWWRMCFWISTIPAALLAILIEFCAESPHWLLKRGRIAETEVELQKLFGALHVKYSMSELAKPEKGEETESIKYIDLFYGRHAKVVFIGSTLFALQQLSGINAVFYFSSTVFNSAGVPSDLANMCVGLVNLSGSIVAMILMDNSGRKVLLVWSFSGMALAMGLQVVGANEVLSGSNAPFLSVAGMILFVLAFSLGAGPVPSLLLSEIFPGRIRAKAMAVCMAVHWVVNFFVGLLFLRLLELLGPQILNTIFGIFCLIAVVIVKKTIFETKGKTLQEIEMALLPAS